MNAWAHIENIAIVSAAAYMVVNGHPIIGVGLAVLIINFPKARK